MARILGTTPRAEFGSVASDVIAIAMGYFAVEAASAADDPPRPDFTRSTRAKRRRLPVETLGRAPLERQSTLFAVASSYSAAYLAAFVRAVERSQMADEINEPTALALRLAEAETYAQRTIAAIAQVSELGLALAQMLEADRNLREVARRQFSGREGAYLLATPYWEKLGSKALELFREAHVHPKMLASAWDRAWPDDPIESSVNTLREAVESSSRFARALQNWGPEPEKSEPPGFWDVA